LQYLEGRSRDIQEEKQKKKDEAKMKSLKLKNLPKALEIINKKYNFVDERKDKINLPKPENDNDIEMKKENLEDNNEESDEDFDDEEDIVDKGKPSFDFLKMDIFNTNLNNNKKEKIKFNKRDFKKIKKKVMRLTKIKKYKNKMNIIN